MSAKGGDLDPVPAALRKRASRSREALDDALDFLNRERVRRASRWRAMKGGRAEQHAIGVGGVLTYSTMSRLREENGAMCMRVGGEVLERRLVVRIPQSDCGWIRGARVNACRSESDDQPGTSLRSPKVISS